MLQKESYTINSDNSGIKKLKIFNIYKHGIGKKGSINFFTYSSIRKRHYMQNPKLLYKHFRKKTRSCIIRTTRHIKNNDGQYLKSPNNNSTLFSKRAERFNISIHGPTPYNLKRQRYFLRSKIII